jgi:hypothetical protein
MPLDRRAFGQREQVVGLLTIRRGLEVLIAKAADGDDDPDSICPGRLDPEVPLARLDQDNGVLLGNPPSAAAGATHMGNPFVRIVPVALIDAADLGGLGLGLGGCVHNNWPVLVRQA